MKQNVQKDIDGTYGSNPILDIDARHDNHEWLFIGFRNTTHGDCSQNSETFPREMTALLMNWMTQPRDPLLPLTFEF